jgi:hypothetical protein
MTQEFNRHFDQGTITIDKTNKEKGEGDIVITMSFNKHGYQKEPVTILVEAKNYNKEVPREETEKFLRDTEFNSERVDGAIFVSLNTRISNHPSIYFDTIGDKHVPIFLISKFNEEGMHSLFIPCILSMISVSKSVKNLYDADIERMRTELNKSLSSLIRQRNLITNSVKNLRKTIDELTESKEIASSLISMIDEFHSSKKLISRLQDVEVDSDKTIDVVVTLSNWITEHTMKVDDCNEKISVNEFGYVLRNSDDVPCQLSVLDNDQLLMTIAKDTELKTLLYYGKGNEYGLNRLVWLNKDYERLGNEIRKVKRMKKKQTDLLV